MPCHTCQGECMKTKNTNFAPDNPISVAMKSDTVLETTPNTGLDSATGPVTIPMYNDYLFRALLQRNNRVLKGLICSLLHLDVEQILTARKPGILCNISIP